MIRRRLLTSDGERIAAQLVVPQDVGDGLDDTVVVVVHGFSGHVAKEQNRRVLSQLSRFLTVVGIDMRGHGASSGECTLGNTEVNDVAAAVRWVRTFGFRRIVLIGFPWEQR